MTAYHAHESFRPTEVASKNDAAAKLLFATFAVALIFVVGTATKNPPMAALDAAYVTDAQTDNGAVTVLAP
jgi:hypothetical protein